LKAPIRENEAVLRRAVATVTIQKGSQRVLTAENPMACTAGVFVQASMNITCMLTVASVHFRSASWLFRVVLEFSKFI
jgi:hypothetical protein